MLEAIYMLRKYILNLNTHFFKYIERTEKRGIIDISFKISVHSFDLILNNCYTYTFANTFPGGLNFSVRNC